MKMSFVCAVGFGESSKSYMHIFISFSFCDLLSDVELENDSIILKMF